MTKPTNLNFIVKVIEYMKYFKQEHIISCLCFRKSHLMKIKDGLEIRKSKATGNSLSLSMTTCIHKIDYNFDGIDCIIYIRILLPSYTVNNL